MTTWPASHRGLRALSGRETARVLKLDQVDPVGVVDGDVAIATRPSMRCATTARVPSGSW
jgi:hypothetical protein